MVFNCPRRRRPALRGRHLQQRHRPRGAGGVLGLPARRRMQHWPHVKKNVRLELGCEKFIMYLRVWYEDSNPQKPHHQFILKVSFMKYLLTWDVFSVNH